MRQRVNVIKHFLSGEGIKISPKVKKMQKFVVVIMPGLHENAKKQGAWSSGCGRIL